MDPRPIGITPEGIRRKGKRMKVNDERGCVRVCVCVYLERKRERERARKLAVMKKNFR